MCQAAAWEVACFNALLEGEDKLHLPLGVTSENIFVKDNIINSYLMEFEFHDRDYLICFEPINFKERNLYPELLIEEKFLNYLITFFNIPFFGEVTVKT